MNAATGRGRASHAERHQAWDLLAFGLVRPRIVVYNAMLQGQFRRSLHTVKPRRLLGEWEGGVGASMPLGIYQLQAVMQLVQGRTVEFIAPKAMRYTFGTVGLFVSRAVAPR